MKAKRTKAKTNGFTLVELLVVISIIAILVALITPAIFGAVRRAKIARISIEIAAMSQALEEYKLNYGQYPPDLSVVNPSGLTKANIAASPNDHLIMSQHLQRSFRARNIDGTVNDVINNGTNGSQFISGMDVLPTPRYQADGTLTELSNNNLADIDASEALVLWLSGFSPNPKNPLRGGNPSKKFEFDQTRLVDRDNDGYFEYYPKGDKSQTPYIYYAASTNGGSYNDTRSHIATMNNDTSATGSVSKFGQLQPLPYGTRVASQMKFARFDSFQIISAGLDGKFLNDDFDSTIAVNNPRAYNATPVSKSEQDNMSNFCEEGTFQDAVDD